MRPLQVTTTLHSSTYHTLARYCQSVVGTTKVESLKFEPHHPKMSGSMVTKISVRDYLPEYKVSSRFDEGILPPPMHTCEVAYQMYRHTRPVFWGSRNSLQQSRYADFDVKHVKRCCFAQGCALLGVPKTKYYLFTPFPPNGNFRAIFDGTKFRLNRSFKIQHFISKQTSIIRDPSTYAPLEV